jgi:hypothetical protein
VEDEPQVVGQARIEELIRNDKQHEVGADSGLARQLIVRRVRSRGLDARGIHDRQALPIARHIRVGARVGVDLHIGAGQGTDQG